MIAEDGISDYGLAKRKAARQAGAPDSRNLPTNLEIEEALRAYQQLYQADEQPERVQRLREVAVEIMRLLTQFNPYLTGAVLAGSAGRHSEEVDRACDTYRAARVVGWLTAIRTASSAVR